MSKTIEAPQLQRGQLELTRQQEQSKDLQGLDVAPFALAEPLAVAIERLQSEGQGQRAVDGSQTGSRPVQGQGAEPLRKGEIRRPDKLRSQTLLAKSGQRSK